MAKTVEDILEALRAIVDGAVDDEGNERPLTEDETQRYEQLEAERELVLNDRNLRKRHAAYGTVTAPVAPSAGPRDDSEVLERAFIEWVQTGQDNQDITQLRAQGEGTGSAGGYLVPTTLLNRLTERMKAFGGIEGAADVLTTASGETLAWPTMDDTANEGEIVNEGAAPTGGADLVFGKRELGAYRFSSTGTGANPLRISIELLADNQFNVEGRVLDKLGERIARHAAPKLITGSGANEPEGILNGCTVANGRSVAVGSGTALTYTTLVAVEHSVDPAYRQMGGCVWAFNDASLLLVKQMTDSNGDPLWLPLNDDRISGGLFRGTLLGWPVVIDQGFPDFDPDSETVNWGVFGRLSDAFVVRNVGGVIVIRDQFARKSQGEVEFVAHARKDSIQNDKNAYIALSGEAD